MTVAKTIQWLIVAVLTFQLVMGIPSHEGSVLCIGENGHREIETAQQGRCSDSTAAAFAEAVHSDVDEVLGDGSHCGPCTDIPFVSADTNAYMVSSRCNAPKMHPNLCTVMAFAPTANLCFSTTNRLDKSFASHKHESVLRPLRSVTLLI